jgi:hypothetical protein
MMTKLKHRHALMLPDWVPQLVAREAKALFREAAHCPDELKLIRRLATDPRMNKVWFELQRRRRKGRKLTNEFLHSVSLPGPFDKDQAAKRRNVAMTALFQTAVARGRLGISMGSPVSVEAARRLDRERAAGLREDAKVFDAMKKGAAARKLVRAAQVYEKRANELFMFGHGKTAAVGFAVQTAKLMCDLFGSPMYGTVATVSSVALNREIEPHTVREWCRGVWGRKFKIAD